MKIILSLTQHSEKPLANKDKENFLKESGEERQVSY